MDEVTVERKTGYEDSRLLIPQLVQHVGWLKAELMNSRRHKHINKMEEYRMMQETYNSLVAILQGEIDVAPANMSLHRNIYIALNQAQGLIKSIREVGLYPIGRKKPKLLPPETHTGMAPPHIL